MTEELWAKVDHYISERLFPPDPVLEATLLASAAAGLPDIQVTANQGRLLWLLARIQGATRILELGTLGGYSTICMARALPPSGRLVTLESDPNHARVARANLLEAGLGDVVELRVGLALDVLPQLAQEKHPPFDLTFIDADKASTADYFEWAVRLSRPGGLIIADNVVRKGAILDEKSSDSGVQGVRRFFDFVSKDKRVSTTAIQTVGAKGYDGFSISFIESMDGTI